MFIYNQRKQTDNGSRLEEERSKNSLLKASADSTVARLVRWLTAWQSHVVRFASRMTPHAILGATKQGVNKYSVANALATNLVVPFPEFPEKLEVLADEVILFKKAFGYIES